MVGDDFACGLFRVRRVMLLPADVLWKINWEWGDDDVACRLFPLS